MKRPRQHVEETVSFKIFSQAIPSDWIIRDITPDYGLDKSVEIVENEKTTGKEFLAQIKATVNLRTTGNTIAYELKIDNVKDYLQRDIPVILVVVDINN